MSFTAAGLASPVVAVAQVPWGRYDLEAARSDERVLAVSSYEGRFSGKSPSWLFLVSQSPESDIYLVAVLQSPSHEDGVWESTHPNRVSVRWFSNYRKWLSLDSDSDGALVVSDEAALLLDIWVTVTAYQRPLTLAPTSGFAELAPEALRAISRREARFAPSDTTSEDRLRRLLLLWQKPVYEWVLAFEVAYGGLRVPDVEEPDDSMWFDEPHECWFLGTYSLLANDCAGMASTDRRPGLVPMAIGPSDAIAYLDERGRVFAEDLIDGQLDKIAESGGEFVEGILTEVRP